jgi:hypothetical protein
LDDSLAECLAEWRIMVADSTGNLSPNIIIVEDLAFVVKDFAYIIGFALRKPIATTNSSAIVTVIVCDKQAQLATSNLGTTSRSLVVENCFQLF